MVTFNHIYLKVVGRIGEARDWAEGWTVTEELAAN